VSDLDFSDLSDDQLVELAIALAREAMHRNPALTAAFGKAVVDERERVEAAARGTDRVKRQAVQKIEEQARAAEEERQRELFRRRDRDALAAYLRRAAAMVGRPVAGLTLVWKRSDFGRGAGRRLQLNAGATGEDASWHLIDYAEGAQRLHTSPGLAAAATEMLAWARETCAAVRALGIDRTIIVKGIEL
jgi:hypothetical protein